MKINYGFLSWLAGGLLIGAFVIVVLHRLQVSRLNMTLLSQARQATREGDHRSAIRYFSKYLHVEYDSADTLIEYATVLRKAGFRDRAIKRLRQALRLEPEHRDARSMLVYLLIDASEYSDAKSYLVSGLADNGGETDDRQDAEFSWLLGCCQRELKQFESSRENFQRAIEEQPATAKYAADLADLLSNRFHDDQAARQILDDLVMAAPNDALVYQVRGRWLLNNTRQFPDGDSEGLQAALNAVLRDAERSLTLNPDLAATMELAVEAAVRADQPERVRRILYGFLDKQSKTPLSTSPKLYAYAADIELRGGQIGSAIEWLENGLKASPGDSDLIWNLAQLKLDLNDFAGFDILANELVDAKYPTAPLRYLQARRLNQAGEHRKAVRILEDSRALFDRNGDLLKRADYLLATCYGTLGQTDRQLETLRRVVVTHPLWTTARISLAEALLRQGQFRESLWEFRQLCRQPDPPVSAMVHLARLVFLDTVNRPRQSVGWGEFDKVILELAARDGTGDQVAILSAEKSVAIGESSHADEILTSRIEISPNSIALRQAMIGLKIQEGQWQQALDTLAKTKLDFGDNAMIHLEHAKCLIRRDGRSVDRASLDMIATPGKGWPVSERIRLAAGMAQYFLALEEFGRCEHCARAVVETPAGRNDLAVHLLLFDLAFRSRDSKSMAQSLENVFEIEGNGPLWRVGEAIRLSVQAVNQPENEAAFSDQALMHLNMAEAERPNWSRIPRLQAEIYDRMGDVDSAIERYRKAIVLGDQNAQMVSRTICLLFEKGRFVEADDVFRKLNRQRAPFSEDLVKVASEISLKLEHFDRALALAKDWAERSDSAQDRIWLAQMYSLVGDTSSAEREFRSAIDQEPALAAGWVSLVQMHCRNGQRDLAMEVIAESSRSLDPQSKDFVIAQCFELLSDIDTATEHYQKAIEKVPDDPTRLRRFADFYLKRNRTSEAKPILEKLSGPAFGSHVIDQSWARRNLALVLGKDGNHERFIKACELLERNRVELGGNYADLRALGIVYGMRPDPESKRRAIEILGTLVNGRDAYSMDDHFLLASLYRSTGDWTNYSRQMRELLGHGGAGNPRFVADYTQTLIHRGEVDEAELWFGRLEQQAPESIDTATIEASLLFASAKPQELIVLLEKLSKDPMGLVRAASLAEGFAMQYSAREDEPIAESLLGFASTWFAKVSNDDQTQIHLEAAFHARQGNLAKTLELVDGKTLGPSQLANLCRDAMKLGQVSADQLTSLIVRARNHPEFTTSVSLMMCVGDLSAWIGQWREATTAYERVLTLDAGYVPALNNLAMVYALSGDRLEDATKAIDLAIEQMGETDQLLDTRGIVRLARGDARAAENDFRASINGRDGVDNCFHLARALLDQRKVDDARRVFRQAQANGLAESRIHPLEKPVFDRMKRRF